VDIGASVEPRALRELRAARERRDADIRRRVGQAALAGIRSQDIATALGVSRSTLWRHYADQLRQPEDAEQRGKDIQGATPTDRLGDLSSWPHP
jgi:DNA-directed RNA polymerase specialized sigma24 family protein